MLNYVNTLVNGFPLLHNRLYMKRILLIAGLILLLVTVPVLIFIVRQRQELRKKAAPATTLAFLPSSVSKKVGDTFSLEIRIDSAENQVVATELHIVFDPDKLEAQSITNGPLFPNILASGVVDRGTASITVGAANAATPVSGTGTAAVIKFKSLAGTTAPVSVRFAASTFVGALGEGAGNVLIGTTPATVTITADSVLITPTLAPEQGQGATSSSQATSSAIQVLSPMKGESVADDTPTIQGKAPSGSTVTVTIYSTPKTYVVTADANGNWSLTPDTPLESGPHQVVASAQDSSGSTISTTSSFVVAGGAGSATESATPIAGNMETTIVLLVIGTLVFLSGLLAPVFTR